MWIGFLTGIVSGLVGLTAYVIHDRRQRLAFAASLMPHMRGRLSEFETSTGDWKAFRDLQRLHVSFAGVNQPASLAAPVITPDAAARLGRTS